MSPSEQQSTPHPPPQPETPQLSIPITLQTPFLYQNRHTGQPSSAPLSIRQLCRILCPPSATTAAAINANPTATITPQTLLLGFDPTTNQYDPAGWKSAVSVPILREACGWMWYYEDRTENGPDGNNTITKGPVSTRNLAELMGDSKIDNSTRVYNCANYTTTNNDNNNNSNSNNNSNETNAGCCGEWKHIQELPYLQMAIEALAEVKSMPTSWPASNEHVSDMTFDGDNNYDNYNGDAANSNGNDKNNFLGDTNGVSQEKIADELQAFLSSTDHLANNLNDNNDDESEEEYESDGGTRYVKDHRTGNWIHEALAPKKEIKEKEHYQKGKNGTTTVDATSTSTNGNTSNRNETIMPGTKKRKRNKPKFSAKNARCWIYVTGLPSDTNEEEVAAYFSKVGIIDLDPETQKPKVKLYRYRKGDAENKKEGNDNNGSTSSSSIIQEGMLKGDASICYARPESVELALQILDENLFRDGATLSVQRAKFEQHGSTLLDDNNAGGKNGKHGRRMVSEAKRKVARLAALQAVGWDEGENGRIAGGLKGLRIVVLMNMFDPKELEHDKNDEKLSALEKEVHAECEELGTVEKITVFSRHPAGVMIVKFTQPNAASDAVTHFNGKVRGDGRKVEASYWDGVTDYTMRDVEKEEKETEKRLDEFGDWLENQELPEEFKLKVDGVDA